VNEAIQRLREVGALKDDHCPRCGTDNWNVDFIAIPSVPLPKAGLNVQRNVVMHVAITSPWSYIPALTLLCTNCGNTIIHNLRVLGLSGGE
jgi:predicted nucleic-acid-binding Zn-ribbon protein